MRATFSTHFLRQSFEKCTSWSNVWCAGIASWSTTCSLTAQAGIFFEFRNIFPEIKSKVSLKKFARVFCLCREPGEVPRGDGVQVCLRETFPLQEQTWRLGRGWVGIKHNWHRHRCHLNSSILLLSTGIGAFRYWTGPPFFRYRTGSGIGITFHSSTGLTGCQTVRHSGT